MFNFLLEHTQKQSCTFPPRVSPSASKELGGLCVKATKVSYEHNSSGSEEASVAEEIKVVVRPLRIEQLAMTAYLGYSFHSLQCTFVY